MSRPVFLLTGTQDIKKRNEEDAKSRIWEKVFIRPPRKCSTSHLLHFGTSQNHLMRVISLNIGRYIATTMKPTVPPRKTMSTGSIIEVRAVTAISTSSS